MGVSAKGTLFLFLLSHTHIRHVELNVVRGYLFVVGFIIFFFVFFLCGLVLQFGVFLFYPNFWGYELLNWFTLCNYVDLYGL